MSKRDRSKRWAALTRSRSAPPRPRPLVTQRMRANGELRSEQLDITEAQVPMTKRRRHDGVPERPPSEHRSLARKRQEPVGPTRATDPDRVVSARGGETASAEL